MAQQYSYGFEQTGTTGAAAEIIKTFYLDGIREIHYKATPLLSRLERQVPKKWIGNEAVIALKMGFDPGTAGVQTEGGALPVPGAVTRDQCTVPIKEIAHTIALSNKLIAVAKGDPYSFVNAVTDKVTNASQAFNFQTDRMLWGDGSGFLCRQAAAVGGSSAAYVIPVATNADLRLLFDGMFVDVIDADTTTQVNNGSSYHAIVSAITNSTAAASASTGPRFTITLQSGTSWTAAPATSDCIVSAGSTLGTRTFVYQSGTSNTFLEMMGLDGVVSTSDPYTGTLQGLARSTITQWQANLRNASSNRPLTIKLMIQAANDCANRGGDPTAIYGDLDQLLSYSQLLTPDVRYSNLENLTGGFKGLAFSFGGSKEIPIFGVKQCKPNQLFFVDESHLFFVQTGPVDWIPGAAGGGMLSWDVGYSQKIGALEWFANLATDNPGSMCLLSYLENPV